MKRRARAGAACPGGLVLGHLHSMRPPLEADLFEGFFVVEEAADAR
jgi:hypothetical protein